MQTLISTQLALTLTEDRLVTRVAPTIDPRLEGEARVREIEERRRHLGVLIRRRVERKVHAIAEVRDVGVGGAVLESAIEGAVLVADSVVHLPVAADVDGRHGGSRGGRGGVGHCEERQCG